MSPDVEEVIREKDRIRKQSERSKMDKNKLDLEREKAKVRMRKLRAEKKTEPTLKVKVNCPYGNRQASGKAIRKVKASRN